MSDNKYDDQEEYKYPEDEQSGEITTQGNTQEKQGAGAQQQSSDKAQHRAEENGYSKKPGIDSLMKQIRQLPFLRNKRMVIILIAVVVLFVLIKMIGGHSSSVSLPKKSKTGQTNAQAQSPLQAKYKVMGTQVRDLSTLSIQNKRDISLLTNNMRQIEKSLQSMNDVMVQLTDEMTDLTKQVKALKTQQDIQKSAINKKIATKPKVYHITAMVPGRAWIKSTDSGQAISVRVGDKLPSYGAITSIDSDNGVVATTSGRIIKFGENDS
jgi:hypothetical protein